MEVLGVNHILRGVQPGVEGKRTPPGHFTENNSRRSLDEVDDRSNIIFPVVNV